MKKFLSLLLALCLMLPLCAAADACAICGGDSVCDTCGGLGYVTTKIYINNKPREVDSTCTAGCVNGNCLACAADCDECGSDRLCDTCGGWGYTIPADTEEKIACSNDSCEDGACTVCDLIDMNTPYRFKDRRIAELVIQQLKPSDTITYGDLRNVTYLDLSFGGLKPFTNSDIPSEKITGISDLTYMIGMRYLNLSASNLTDISPLTGLTELKELNLSFNKIQDISPLSSLTNLKKLDLSGNNIQDISPLKSLNNLMYLELSDNNIQDISPLVGLTNLQKLDLSDNNIQNISLLKSLSIKTLTVSGNPATATPTPKPTATPKRTATPKPTATPRKEQRKCGICDGDGKCNTCGGDMWYEGYEWSYDSNGLPQSNLVRKLCGAIYCFGGKCDHCGGDGWID